MGAEYGDAREIARRLARAGCLAPHEEAADLVAAAPDAATLEAWVGRRERGEPLAWITGTARFCGAPLRVDPGVYVPRPQTEELAQRAVELLAARGGRGTRAADLCTGCGAVASHLARVVPGAAVVGVDIDHAAARCARGNGVPVIVADVCGPRLALRSRSFDVVTAVAPYVPTGGLRLLPADVQRHEPRRALDGGRDGLGVVRPVVAHAARVLRPGGWLLLELGGTQHDELRDMLDAARFGPSAAWFDEHGDLRGIAARAVTAA